MGAFHVKLPKDLRLGLKPPFPLPLTHRQKAAVRAVVSKSYWDDLRKRASSPETIAALRKFLHAIEKAK